MENMLLLLGIGGFIVFIILRFDKSQRKRVNNVFVETGKVEPLFMKQAAEQKMFALKQAITDFEKTLAAAQGAVHGEESLHKIEEQIAQLVSNYSQGELPLSIYCSKLDNLAITVKRLKNDLVTSAA